MLMIVGDDGVIQVYLDCCLIVYSFVVGGVSECYWVFDLFDQLEQCDVLCEVMCLVCVKVGLVYCLWVGFDGCQ